MLSLNKIGNNPNLYIPYKFLIQKGISPNTIKCWVKKDIVCIRKEYGCTSILYDSIPFNTRNKLPGKEAILSEIKQENKASAVNAYYLLFQKAKEKNATSFRSIYLNKVPQEQLEEYLQKHAVLEEILKIYEECKRTHTQFPLKFIHPAFRMIFPKSYVYAAFSTAIRKAYLEGIERLLIKDYKPAPIKYDTRYEKMVLDCMSDPRKFNQSQIARKIWKICDECNMLKPGLSWIKEKCKKFETLTGDRNGKYFTQYKKYPYLGLEKAQNANTQWQVDGWDMPFYYGKYQKLTIFKVMDSYSGKIVGFYVAESENTESILKGLEYAITDTGVVPSEIVSDKHSFHQTKEAEYFKDELAKLGTVWTVDINARRKSLAERNFGIIGENYCKDYPGYFGQGVKTRMKNGRPAQEIIDEAMKKPLTKEYIMCIAKSCVDLYNSTPGKDGKSPNERYEEAVNNPALRKYSLPVDEVNIVKLFVRCSENKITGGLLRMTRERTNYIFEVSAKDYLSLNNKTFRVRYVSLKDEVFLFDLKTDKFITILKRQKIAHAAIADQTEEDEKIFLKHHGRIRGIEHEIKKEQERITAEANNIDPNIAEMMNRVLTPKDALKEMKEKCDGRLFAERQGFNINNVISPDRKCMKKVFEPKDKEKEKKRERPFHEEKKVDAFSFISGN